MRRLAGLVTFSVFIVAGASAQQNPLQAAAFMAGCWRGAAGADRVIEEYYMVPSANLMQGMTRYLARRANAEPQTVDYEFTLIEANGAATRLHPHPKGQPSPDKFSEKERAPGRLVWENLAHDFPQRITYAAAAGDSLIARIEGKTSQGERAMEWRMGRVRCPQ